MLGLVRVDVIFKSPYRESARNGEANRSLARASITPSCEKYLDSGNRQELRIPAIEGGEIKFDRHWYPGLVFMEEVIKQFFA